MTRGASCRQESNDVWGVVAIVANEGRPDGSGMSASSGTSAGGIPGRPYSRRSDGGHAAGKGAGIAEGGTENGCENAAAEAGLAGRRGDRLPRDEIQEGPERALLTCWTVLRVTAPRRFDGDCTQRQRQERPLPSG
ncbi:hypothetical protein VTK73DRAFT_8170 [Phialemonium thermophilum]|uniref:Uncharacterized protein n=1 Tax=Phialemonium thermophilum TaxID=223376 RepID=A0ABR3WAP5_9PEZI